jgi:hypothetical protein
MNRLSSKIRTRLALAVVACAAVFASPAGAVVVPTAQVGGSGGTAFTQTCPNGEILSGLQGTSGTLIDSVESICTKLDVLGDNFTDPVVLSSHGGSGARGYDLECPKGWAVTGLTGRSGSFVDRVQLICAPVQLDGTVLLGAAEKVDPFSAGGTGGSAFTIHCPGTTPARGIDGRAGTFVDRLGLGCENAGLQAFRPDGQSGRAALPDFRAVTRDLPFKVVKGSTVEYRVDMWNVGRKDAPVNSSMDLLTGFPIAFPTIDFTSQAERCDFGNPPPVQGHFLRCYTNLPTHPFEFPPMDIGVTFTANGSPGNYTFGGQPNPDGSVRTVGKALTRLGQLKVVDNVGTFELTPTAATVAPHERIDYAVTWTVPPPLDWNDLRTVQLRFSDDERSVLWVQFDRLDGTLSLRNLSGDQSGPAYRPGRHGRLSNEWGAVELADSSVQGSGPTGPSVTLNLGLQFKPSLAGRTLHVDVLATGPDGFEQLGDEAAGTLTVTQ